MEGAEARAVACRQGVATEAYRTGQNRAVFVRKGTERLEILALRLERFHADASEQSIQLVEALRYLGREISPCFLHDVGVDHAFVARTEQDLDELPDCTIRLGCGDLLARCEPGARGTNS
jgi:hypothetical protein